MASASAWVLVNWALRSTYSWVTSWESICRALTTPRAEAALRAWLNEIEGTRRVMVPPRTTVSSACACDVDETT